MDLIIKTSFFNNLTDKKNMKTNVDSGGCPTVGCKGIGHIKGAKYTGHHRFVF